MVKRILLSAFLSLCGQVLAAQLTLEQCVVLAQENYPLVSRYELLDRTREINLFDIDKGWLPQITVYGQGTVQNVVPSFPDPLSDMMADSGMDFTGLGRVQYKAGADITQTLWDGGQSKSSRKMVRMQTDERRSELDVRMYAVRERVENLFFSILLMDEQVRLTRIMSELLESNLRKLRSMKANGTAMQSDVDMVEAEYLSSIQKTIQAESNAMSCRRMLGIFVGMDISGDRLVRPEGRMPSVMSIDRPELRLYEARFLENDAKNSVIKAGTMPRIGLFAQGFYGYPGFDYFSSMMNREPSFNFLAGIKVTWNIGSFYTKKNSERRLRFQSEGIVADREVFLFNTSILAQSQKDRIKELSDIMTEDGRIVELRASVRKAAESQLENGVIDVTTLLTKITDENRARLMAIYHEIEHLQSIYQLKYTLNR